jgi:transcriptional regulator with XRE-family HTH domain
MMTPEQFKGIRKKLGLTQAQLAAVLDYNSDIRISEIEHGTLAIQERVAHLMLAFDAGFRTDNWPKEKA